MKDPTKTLTLRNKTIREVNRRFARLNKLIRESVITNRVFHTNAEALPENAFRGLNDSQSVTAWNIWLAATINEIILQVPPQTPLLLTPSTAALSQQWLVEPVLEAYRRGVIAESNRLVAQGIKVGPPFLGAPRHVTTTQILSNRVFTELKGVTRTMADQITQVLTRGIIEGQGAHQIADNITDRVNKIGRTRARLITRTEIVYANNLARLTEDQLESEILGEEIVVRWVTAGDERVRHTHSDRNGRYYTQDRALRLLGEPNCRCVVTAVLESRVPVGATILS